MDSARRCHRRSGKHFDSDACALGWRDDVAPSAECSFAVSRQRTNSSERIERLFEFYTAFGFVRDFSADGGEALSASRTVFSVARI